MNPPSTQLSVSVHRSCPDKETDRKSVFPKEEKFLLPIFEDLRKKSRACSIPPRWSRKRKRCVREIFPTGGKQGGREERKEDGQTVDQFHASSTNLSRERVTRTAVQRRFFAVCRDKLDSNWQFEFILELGFARNPSFETDSIFLSSREEFLILSLSFNFLWSNSRLLFPNVSRETSCLREGRA